MYLSVCSYHVMKVFQSESTLYSCLNVKELLAWSRCKIWSLSYCNWTRTHNYLVHKWTLNHLATLAKWLSGVVKTYLYGAFDCMFLSCHVHISEWIHTLYLLECQELLARSRPKIWSLQLDSNWTLSDSQNHLVHKRTLNH